MRITSATVTSMHIPICLLATIIMNQSRNWPYMVYKSNCTKDKVEEVNEMWLECVWEKCMEKGINNNVTHTDNIHIILVRDQNLISLLNCLILVCVFVWNLPECGMSGCSVLWQGDSGSSTGPLLLTTPSGRRTSMHCRSSSACWATGRPMGAWAWLTSPQASGAKSIGETHLKKYNKKQKGKTTDLILNKDLSHI